MSESDGQIGFGTKLRYGDAENDVDTPIGEITDVTPPGMTVADAEFTNNDSDDHIEEFKPGMITLGNVSFDMNFITSEWQEMWDLGKSREIKFFEIEYPDGYVQPFKGYINNLQPKAPMKDRIVAGVGIKVTSVGDMSAS